MSKLRGSALLHWILIAAALLVISAMTSGSPPPPQAQPQFLTLEQWAVLQGNHTLLLSDEVGKIPIFSDDFESGSSADWSSTVP